ncbi:MAG: hypothetical protein H7039_17500 [Bryobacteraceae bacterium]|nr:hypothetical protein [Bryobacteraceae bacterium]
MKVAGLLACLLATAVAVYPEAPPPVAKNAASRTTTASSPVTGLQDGPLITDTTVYGWLSSWQHRLGLDEWKIEARIVRSKDLQKGTVANIHWSLPKRTATIKVLNPVDSNLPRSEVVRDTELSVVHELVHLSMAKLPLDGGNPDLEEETVKRISIALVALDKRDDELRQRQAQVRLAKASE